MKTLTNNLTRVDLIRTDRQGSSLLSVFVKGFGTLWAASFVAGATGDVWLTAMVMVGYPAAWSVAWIISK